MLLWLDTERTIRNYPSDYRIKVRYVITTWQRLGPRNSVDSVAEATESRLRSCGWGRGIVAKTSQLTLFETADNPTYRK